MIHNEYKREKNYCRKYFKVCYWLTNSPDWFDYDSVSSQSSRGKLEHAFQLAYDRLHVDKLLDWQGTSALLHSFPQVDYSLLLRE